MSLSLVRAPFSTAVAMRETAIGALMREHGITRDEAVGVLRQAEHETRDPVAEAAREAQRQQDAEAARLERLVADLEVPVRPEIVRLLVRGAGLNTEPVRDVARWMGTPRRVIAVLGDMGTGKTVAALGAILIALRARQTCAYVREADVVRIARSNALWSEERMHHLRTVGMLVVDELEQTLSQDAEQAGLAVSQLVDARVRAGRTVLVGNMNAAGFVARYGRRCMDRVREVGAVHEYKLATGERSLRAGV